MYRGDFFRRVLLALAMTDGLAAQEPPVATFGTTVAAGAGLEGKVYLIKPDAEELPNFKRLHPLGTVYTTSLRVTPRSFLQGFPGITDRFEWFAIDYTGRFWVETPGVFRFRLLSDDGAKLHIDDKLLIDNDGMHAPMTTEGSAELSRGVHRIRVSYFQGPREMVALVLSVTRPENENWKIFDTNDFPPPADPAEWAAGTIRKVQRGSNW